MDDMQGDGLKMSPDIRDTETARRYFSAGQTSEAEGDRIAAIEAYEAAFAADPDDPEICFRLAYILDLVGEEDEAMHLYEQCVQGPNPSLNALLNLAVLYEDRDQYAKADRCIRQVLATDPVHERAHLFFKDVMASASMIIADEREPEMEAQSAIIDTPVTDFDLSVKTRNAIRKMDIRTLGDLLRISEVDLQAYKSLGDGSLQEIRTMLAQRGLRLGQAIDQQKSAVKQAVYDQIKTKTGSGDELLSRGVMELTLSVRARKALSLLSVKSLGELCMRTEAELMGMKNFGMTSLLEIKEKLAEIGLSLRQLEEDT